MSTTRRLLALLSTNAFYGLFAAAIGVATNGLLYRSLGIQFGVMALVATGMIRFNLIDDSLGAFVVTTVSKRRASLTSSGLGGTTLLYHLIGSLSGLTFATALLFLFSSRSDRYPIALMAGLGLYLTMIASLSARYLEGFEAYPTLRITQAILATVRLVGIVILFWAGESRVGAYVALYTAVALLAVISLRSVVSIRFSSPAKAAMVEDEIRSAARFAKPLLVAKGAAIASYRLDLWIVQVFLGSAGTTAYAMAEALAQLVAQSLEIFRALLPVSVSILRNRDSDDLKRFVLGSTKASVFVVGSVGLTMWAAMNPLLNAWFGEVITEAIAPAALLIGFYYLTASRSPLQLILIGRDEFSQLQWLFVQAAGINATLSVALTYGIGITGPALGTLIAGFYLLVRVTTHAERFLGIPATTVFRYATVPSLVSASVAMLVATPFGAQTTMAGGVARASLALGVFAMLTWIVGLTRVERRTLIKALSRNS